MALKIPDALANLEANCGIYALWMLFHHHGMQVDIDNLIKTTQYDDQEGTFTIALAIALKKFGFGVTFYTDEDPNIGEKEQLMYVEAQKLQIPILPELSYEQIQQAISQEKFVIVYYDTVDEVGNQSLVYSIDEHEICFFDSFEPMPVLLFENQRNAEGICRQAIVIDDEQFQMSSTLKN
ncbi:peptidase C39 [Acinetobacter sp. ANC 4558]|uniref:cysteine peptidase family C39 domain-containing protein n=1 Tax=Acinetobacter sp. ANC 4558 TaxID=1977876 RepID=UPI000A354D9A|nr:cysteine peptidase family C39 domain-containing protein [Acinetobacter sp. ANC 4558]OTG87493.1 peptidase C39 [Acinetobacter sp. ANC 4558]